MYMDTNGVEIEDEVRDKVSGFEGKVVGLTQWTTGCARAAVQPKLSQKNQEEGTMPKMWDIDCLNLVVVHAGPRHEAAPDPALVGAARGMPPTPTFMDPDEEETD